MNSVVVVVADVAEVPAATRFPVITEYFDSEMDDNTQSDNTLFRSPGIYHPVLISKSTFLDIAKNV